MAKTPRERFEAKYDVDPNGCWIWNGAKDGSGYGKFLGSSKVMTPHKFAFEEYKKQPVPEGQVVRHSCDRPLCVNPNHLTLGTYSENAKERWARTGKTLKPVNVITQAITKALPSVTNEQLLEALAALGLSSSLEAQAKDKVTTE